jgi:hypothetical protein
MGKCYHAEGMKDRPPVWRCYLCRRSDGEGSLRVDFDRHTIDRPRLALDEFKVQLSDVSWIYYLCLECFVLMRHLSKSCRKEKQLSPVRGELPTPLGKARGEMQVDVCATQRTSGARVCYGTKTQGASRFGEL